MAFVLDWQKRLGYKTDPFVDLPQGKTADFFVDREAERAALNLFVVKQSRFGLLQGSQSSGKTTLLRWVEEQLRGGQVRALLLDGSVGYDAFLDATISATLNPLEKRLLKPQAKVVKAAREDFLIHRIADKQFIILVDNAQGLEKESKALLKRILASCAGAQLIFAVERALKEHEEYGEDALGLTLEEMDNDALIALLRQRIALVGGDGTYPFDEEACKRLIATSKRNPRKLLVLAREQAIEISVKGPPPRRASKTAPSEKAVRIGKATKAKGHGDDQEETDELQSGKRRWLSFRFVKDEDDPVIRLAGDEEQEEKQAGAVAKDAEHAKGGGRTRKAADRPRKEPEAGASEVEDILQSIMEEIEANEKRKQR